jgi:hypothetical protein
LFTVSDALYANITPLIRIECVNNTWSLNYNNGTSILEWDGADFVNSTFNPYGEVIADRIAHPVIYKGQTVYIAAQSVNDHQWQPVGLFTVDDRLQPQRLTPLLCSRPQDIETANKALYVLCNEPQENGWTITIYGTCDLAAWDQLLTMNAPTFARSFALAPQGKIYIGLGADTDASVAAQEAVGQVWENQLLSVTECSAP